MLLRLGTGVVDTWADHDLSRGKINKLLREAKMAASIFRVEKPFIDTMVQHAIGTAVEQNAAPPAMLLEMAELLGGTEWKERRLDTKAEADRLFNALAENPAHIPDNSKSLLLLLLPLVVLGVLLLSGFTPASLTQMAAISELLPGKRGAVMGLY